MLTGENQTTSPSQSGENVPISFTVDSFANGIAFGQHKLEVDADPRDYYALRVADDSELVRVRSRYLLDKHSPLQRLEQHLMRLSRRGILRQSQIFFGVSTDPFLPFEGKFDASMRFLDLFQRYTPGMLVVQTRSPLIVIALPVFKRLGAHTAVTIPIETTDDAVVRRYTPGLPRIDERLKAASALRRFGVEVTIQVSPVLPYGDWKKDAEKFAVMINEHADYIHVRSITDGSERVERRLRSSALAQKLAHDRMFHFLRPDSANPLISALEKIAPEKLRMPPRLQLLEKQLGMFAA